MKNASKTEQEVMLRIPTQSMDEAIIHMVEGQNLHPKVVLSDGTTFPILGATFGSDAPHTIHFLFNTSTSRGSELLWRVTMPSRLVYEEGWESYWIAHRVTAPALKALTLIEPDQHVNRLVTAASIAYQEHLSKRTSKRRRQKTITIDHIHQRAMNSSRVCKLCFPRGVALRGLRIHDMLLQTEIAWQNGGPEEASVPTVHAAFTNRTNTSLAVYASIDELWKGDNEVGVEHSRFCSAETWSLILTAFHSKQLFKSVITDVSTIPIRVRYIQSRATNRALKSTLKLPLGA